MNLCLLVFNSIFCRETKKYSVRSKLNRSKYRSVLGLRTEYKIPITVNQAPRGAYFFQALLRGGLIERGGLTERGGLFNLAQPITCSETE